MRMTDAAVSEWGSGVCVLMNFLLFLFCGGKGIGTSQGYFFIYLFLLFCRDESGESSSVSSFQFLFHLDEEFYTVTHELEETELGESETISVGHVIDTSLSCGIYTTSSTLLETEFVENLVEFLLVLGEVGNGNVYTSTQTCSQVAGAGEYVTEMVVVHEVVAGLLEGFLEFGEALTEATEYLLDVSTLLHRDDAEMILLVYPHKEGLLIVVPDSTSVRPLILRPVRTREDRTYFSSKLQSPSKPSQFRSV